VQSARALRPDGCCLPRCSGADALGAADGARWRPRWRPPEAFRLAWCPWGRSGTGKPSRPGGLALPVADAIPYPVSYPDAFALLARSARRWARAMRSRAAAACFAPHCLMCAMAVSPRGGAGGRALRGGAAHRLEACGEPAQALRPGSAVRRLADALDEARKERGSDAALGRRAPDAYVMVFMEAEGPPPVAAWES
jgi:hypothetical protein